MFKMYNPTDKIDLDLMELNFPEEEGGSIRIKLYFGITGSDRGYTVEVTGWDNNYVSLLLSGALSELDQFLNDAVETPATGSPGSLFGELGNEAPLEGGNPDDEIPF